MSSGTEGVGQTAAGMGPAAVGMTKRQREVLERLELGMTVKQIATDTGVSRAAVYQMIERLRRQGALPEGFTPSGAPARRIGPADAPGAGAPAAIAPLLAWALALVVALVAVGARGPVGRAVAGVLRGLEVVATVTPHFWLGAVLIAVVAAGLGYAVMPAQSAPYPGVAALRLIEPEITHEIALVTPRGRPDAPAVGALVREVMRMRWPSGPNSAVAANSRVPAEASGR